MNYRKLKYLAKLSKKRQKNFLAWLILKRVNALRRLDLTALELKSELLIDQIEELNSKKDVQKVEGLDYFMVLADDLKELLEIEEELDDYIFEVSEVKKTIVELRNGLIERMGEVL